MITITPGSQGFTMPPPSVVNMAMPPPPIGRYPPPQRFGPRNQFFQPFKPYTRGISPLDPEFDGKRLRKSAMRKTVDYNSAIIKMLEGRVWQRDYRDRRALQPDVTSLPDLLPPPSYDDNAINAVTTRFVKAATNKMRCPIFCMAWTPEGRRLVTGASSGEFTLWNGLTFNFETILQAHDSPVRTMVWSHNDVWMVTADHAGYVKYWQSNMNNVKMFLAHKEAIRGISFSPTDSKFATCSDDGTVRIWDFQRCQEEKTLRGHGADVKCVHWHPQMGLVISGSKDNQQPVKLWDPKTGQSLATLHAHKSTVMDVKWNNNGNWVVTASRDHLLKLFDIRNLSSEVQTFRGHKKESSSVAWHPYHEGLFCSGGSDGAILFWHVGADKEVGAIEQAHDSIVWTLAWHPLGHILCSGSNDHSSKFWTRNRPGDQMRDKYNLNTLPSNLAGLDDNEIDDTSMIPGMGPEDKVDLITPSTDDPSTIPGLDIDSAEDKSKVVVKKVPYSKPIPKNFQAHWNHLAVPDDDKDGFDAIELLNQLIVNQPGVIPLAEIEPESLIIYGKQIDLKPEDGLTQSIKKGCEAFARYINSGAVEELNDVRPYIDLSDEESGTKKELHNDQDNADEEEDYEQYADPYHHDDDDLIAEQEQDMRNMVMRPPPGFMGPDGKGLGGPMGGPMGGHMGGPSSAPRPMGDMFHARMPAPDGPPHMFRPPGPFRPNFRPDSQGPGQFQRPPMNFNRGPEFRDGNRQSDYRDNNERMEYRDNSRPPDFRDNRGQDLRDNRGQEFQENMYRGPQDSYNNRNKNQNQNDGYRSEFGAKSRGNAPPFRGRNQGFRDNRNDYNEEDEDMGGSYGNGGYAEEGEEGETWDKEEQYEDTGFNKWNEEGSGDQEGMDDEYQDDRRPPFQHHQQKSFSQRSRPPRSRGGGPRGGRGFDRGGPRMRGRGRGRGAPRGGFRSRSRGRNPRR